MANKGKVTNNEIQSGWSHGLVLSAKDGLGLAAIRGRVLTVIEGLGLPQKQEEAIKNLVTRALFADEKYYVWIDSDLHKAIREASYKNKSESVTNQTPERMVGLADIEK